MACKYAINMAILQPKSLLEDGMISPVELRDQSYLSFESM